jgi:hypothetical protein
MAAKDRVEKVEAAPPVDSRAERGTDAPPLGRTAKRYVTTVSPEHGEPVTFIPGELLPTWAVAAHDKAERDGVGK